MITDTIVDVLMFRKGSEDEFGTKIPVFTTGSIVWGVLLRTFLLLMISLLLLENYQMHDYWWLMLFIIWAVAIYPAWRQYRVFQEKVKKISEETLCGSCRNFDITSQLCKIYDEHITKDYLPCNGESWEPVSFEEKNN